MRWRPASLITLSSVAVAAFAACDTGPKVAATIELVPPAPTIFAGDTLRFRAIVKDSSGNVIPGAKVAWIPFDDPIVTIDPTGLATARLFPDSASTTIQARIGPVARNATVTVQPCRSSCGSWIAKAGMPDAKQEFVMGIVGSVLFVTGGAGGPTPASAASTALEAYDPAVDAWTRKASMPDGRRYAVAATSGGLLYVLGGSPTYPFLPTATFRSYDPSTNTWTDRPPMPTARIGFASGGSVAVLSGIVYALGADGAFDAYDPSTNTWTTRPSPPRLGAVPSVISGKIYAAGGGSASASQSVDVYDPSTNTWTSRAPMPTARSGVHFTVVSGRLYAIGGLVTPCGLPPCDTYAVEVYDPLANSWATKAPLPVTNASVTLVESLNGIIYVGRSNKLGWLAYDPVANAWSVKSSMPIPAANSQSATASFGGRIYVVTSSVFSPIPPLLVFTP